MLDLWLKLATTVGLEDGKLASYFVLLMCCIHSFIYTQGDRKSSHRVVYGVLKDHSERAFSLFLEASK